MNLKQCKEEYAKLLVLGGVCLQPGERVIVNADVKNMEMAELVAKTAYECGASKVEMRWSSARVEAYAYEHADIEELKKVEEWEEKKQQLQVEQLPCAIHLVASEPIFYSSEMLANQSEVMMTRVGILKKYRDAMDGKFKWSIGGVPTQEWADQVFPGEENNLEHLWESVLQTLMITGDGTSVEKWDRKWEEIQKHVDYMNSLKLKSIHLKTGLGTDLTMDLLEDVLWDGGADVKFGNAPNLPSEEVFTSPKAGKAEGVLVSSTPLVCQNQVIEGLKLVFKDGKVVEVTADSGEEFFSKYLQIDEGASMLGEVAIIDRFSPIKAVGHLFYHTLYDENAACHIAVGRAFPFLHKDFDTMTAEELDNCGLNQSGIHCDIMFGTDDTDITGITMDGQEVQILANGKWCN